MLINILGVALFFLFSLNVYVRDDLTDIESEKSEVVKVLVATPLKISVKTSSSKVILTTEFF